MTDRIPLIQLSGGLDSTYLTQLTLYSEPCDVMYCSGIQHPDKVAMERQARTAIIELFNRVMPHKVQREYEPETVCSFNDSPSRSWAQILPWLVYALQVVDPDRHSKVLTGYVMGDSNNIVIEDIKNAWEAMWKITKHGPVVPMEFPLLRCVKSDIMKVIDPRAYKLIWVCETPIESKKKGPYAACGECIPCQAHDSAKRRFKIDNGISYAKYHRAALRRTVDNPPHVTSPDYPPMPGRSRRLVKSHIDPYSQ